MTSPISRFAFIFLLVSCTAAHGQIAPSAPEVQMGGMHHDGGIPSTTLRLTGASGELRVISPGDLKTMPHITVDVVNGHTTRHESYSGVRVKDLIALVAPAKLKPAEGNRIAMAPAQKSSPRMTVIVAGATDGFQVAITLCDTDPGCRSGESIVADARDGKPLTVDGSFKLVLSEDKTPGRWVRNLNSLTVKNLTGI